MLIANECAKKETAIYRLLGVFSSLIIGGICIYLGWESGPKDGLIIGWVSFIGGIVMALLGIWTSLVGTRQEIEERERAEQIEDELSGKQIRLAKEEGKKILEKGFIDDFRVVDDICRLLENVKLIEDYEAHSVLWDLQDLKKKQIKREKKNR